MGYRHLQWTLWIIGIALQYLVLSALFQGAWRDFPFVTLYVLSLMVTTVSDIVAQFTLGRNDPLYYAYYWTAELLRQTALFCLVLSFAAETLAVGRSRRMALTLVFTIAAVFWCGTILFYHQPDLNKWMTRVVRNLSFASAILNLGLWFLLISASERCMKRLLLVGALGLQMTGEAMGQALRYIFPKLGSALAASLLIVFSHFLCLIIWWQTISNSERASRGASARHA